MCKALGSAKPVDKFGLQQQQKTNERMVVNKCNKLPKVMWYGKGTSRESQVSMFLMLHVAAALRTSRLCSLRG